MKQTTRRSFLPRLFSDGLVMAIPPFYVHASDKSGTRLPVVGSGPHTYECVHDWLVPPEGLVWGDTTDFVRMSRDTFMSDTPSINRACAERQSSFSIEKGHFFVLSAKAFAEARTGLKLRREGKEEFLYHCDINRCRAVKTTLTGSESGYTATRRKTRTMQNVPSISCPRMLRSLRMVTFTSVTDTAPITCCGIRWTESS